MLEEYFLVPKRVQCDVLKFQKLRVNE